MCLFFQKPFQKIFNSKTDTTTMKPPIKGPAILLFKGRGIVSTLIRWQSRGQYSHAA